MFRFLDRVLDWVNSTVIVTCVGACLAAMPALALTDEQDEQVSSLINQGALDAAWSYLDSFPHSPEDRFLVQGRIAKANGQIPQSIELLRAGLNRDPDNLQIRRELAHTLFVAGKYSSAKFHLERLMETDPDLMLQQGYRSVLSELHARRPLSFSGYFSIEPTTNLNGGSTKSELKSLLGKLTIDEDSKAQSGTRVQFGGTASFHRALTDSDAVLAGLSLHRSFVTLDGGAHSTAAKFELGYERRGNQLGWRLIPYVQRYWSQGTYVQQDRGLQLDLWRQLSQQDVLHAGIVHESRAHEYNAAKDGTFSSLSLSWARAVSPRLSHNIGLYAEKSRPGTKHQRYDGLSLVGGFDYAFEGGSVTSVSAHLGKRGFHGMYPFAVDKRDDVIFGVSASWQLNQVPIFGLAPVLECSHSATNSTIALFQSRSTGCGVSLSKNF